MDYAALFTYDAETGNIIWKRRDIPGSWNIRFEGQVAGWKLSNAKGPTEIRVTLSKRSQAVHRIIWEMHHGPIPDGLVIDHRDRNPWNNRLNNLRLATRQQNMRNSSPNRASRSGVKGVGWSKQKKAWGVRLSVTGGRIHLGFFKTLEEAKIAYMHASIRVFGEFACYSPPSIRNQP